MILSASIQSRHLVGLFCCVVAICWNLGFAQSEDQLGGSAEVHHSRSVLAGIQLSDNVEALDYDVELTFDFERKYLNGKVDIMLRFGVMQPKRSLGKMDAYIHANKLKSRGFHYEKSTIEKELCRPNLDDYIKFNIQNYFIIKKVSLLVAESLGQLEDGQGQRIDVETVWGAYDGPYAAIQLKQHLPAHHHGKLSIEYERAYTIYEYMELKESQYLKLNMGKLNDRGNLQTYYSINPRSGALDLFPCFDDTHQRATLSIAINHNLASGQILSNMPASSNKVVAQDESKFSRIEFPKTTKPIAVRKFALAIGQFDEPLVVKAEDGFEIQLITAGGQREKGKFALDVARRSLDWLRKYTGVDPVLKTIKIVGSPSVEEWSVAGGPGMSLMDFKSLLVDEKQDSAERKTLVAYKIALAMARQWFGGVTIEDAIYKELWIPEGLASHLAIKIIGELELGFVPVKDFVRVSLLRPALAADTNVEEHLSGAFNGRDLHGARFNLIRLVKGASIMQMLERDIVGDSNKFKDIVRSFARESGEMSYSKLASAVRNAQFKVTVVEEVLTQWIDQGDYPMIEVSLSDEGRLRLKQRPKTVTYRTRNYYWPLKLKVLISNKDGTNTDVKTVSLFDFCYAKKTLDFDLPSWFGSEPTDFVKLIRDDFMIEYYAVAYSSDLWERLPRPTNA